MPLLFFEVVFMVTSKPKQIKSFDYPKLFSYLLVFLSIFLFIWFVATRRTSDFKLYLITDTYGPLIFEGFLNTIWISIIALLGSMILGFIFYLFSITKDKYFGAYLRAFTNVFTEIIYGTPLLVMVVISAFVIGPAFNVYSRNITGLIGLIIYISPYMKNVFQAAFSSVGNDQYMAMDLFGFTPFQRYRYIIIPQVVRILMPPLMNNFSLIIKGSALLYVLSFNELYYSIVIAQSKTFAFVEGYLLMWALYLLITIPLSQLTKIIERKWSL
jgi:polar amino acid transport system permease protein